MCLTSGGPCAWAVKRPHGTDSGARYDRGRMSDRDRAREAPTETGTRDQIVSVVDWQDAEKTLSVEERTAYQEARESVIVARRSAERHEGLLQLH